MDFQGQYFAGTGQPYGFMGIPPLTPSHSHSAASDDFTTSPPEGFENFPNEPFHQGFEFQQQFNQQSQAFPGPPTPPNHPAIAGQQQQQQQPPQALNGHQIKPQHQAEIVPQQPKIEPAGDDLGQNGRGHSNSEEDDLTPAQSRRKAQNRAAQRAFRERKERHVKELEQALASLKESQQETAAENERLKRDIQKISTENEILRATSSMQHGPNGSLSPEPTMTGPMQYNPTDFYSNVLSNHPNKTPSHRIVTSDDGERLLAAGATWDFIISHELYKRGLVDVGDVSERLKHQARCDGQGPVFSERSILEAIKSSVASGSDELL